MDEPGSGIDILPDHVLLNVFKYLDLEDLLMRVQLVSKYWQSLSYDRSLWTELEFKWKGYFLKDQDLKNLLEKFGQYVEMLNLNQCLRLTINSLEIIGDLCVNLKEIMWDAMPVPTYDETFNVLYNFVCSRPELRCFEFGSVYFPGVFENCCGNLETLNCLGDTFDTSGLNDLNDMQCKSLCLIAERNMRIRVLKTNVLDNTSIERIVNCCAGIEILSLERTVGIDSHALDSVFRCLHHLKELNISQTMVDDRMLNTCIKTSIPNLMTLNISGCRKITDVGILHLANNCPGLVNFVLNEDQYMSGSVTDVGLGTIAGSLPLLQKLSVGFCPSVTSLGIKQIAESCADLREINMSGCVALNDQAFIALAGNCKKLEIINCSQCLQLGSLAAEMLFQLPGLKILNMESCRKVVVISLKTEMDSDAESLVDSGTIGAITRETLSSIPRRTSDLKHLNLSFCSQMKSSSLEAVSRFCPNLKYVNLSACSEINSSCIEELTKNCSKLSELDLSNASSFRLSQHGDEALISISKYCKNLKVFHMESNFSITMVGVEAVLKCCINLKKISLSVGRNLDFGELTMAMRCWRGTCQLWDSFRGGRLMSINTYALTHKGKCTFIFPPLYLVAKGTPINTDTH